MSEDMRELDMIRVWDGEDFRFYRDKWFGVAPIFRTTGGSGVKLFEEDGTFIGFISGRQLLDLARSQHGVR